MNRKASFQFAARSKAGAAALACLLALASAAARETRAQDAGGGANPQDAASAASAESPYKLPRGTYEFGAWAGWSPGSTTFFGRSPDRRLFIAGLRAGRVMGSKKHFDFEWTVDVVPFVRLVQPREVRPFVTEDGRPILASSGPDATGAGIMPVGAKFRFRRRERVKPFAETTWGVVYFDRPVPYDAARSFNFMFDFGGGVQILSRSRRALTVGYKFHHVSNAYTGDINPGLDSHVFYAGYSIFRR